jgi:hypothetical protein
MDFEAGKDPTDSATHPTEPFIADIRRLTALQLQQLGVSHMAYVKQVPVNGGIAFAIHAADGTPMALAANQDLAIAAIQQHEMAAALVH